MKQLDQETIESICRVADMPLPPVDRFRVRQYRQISKVPPLERRRPAETPQECSTIEHLDIPTYSGIYFFWRQKMPYYVGQSVNLQQRLLPHLKKRYTDEVAWLPFDVEDLLHAEMFYIGVLRPLANFKGVKRVEVDQGDSYYVEERIGDLVLSRGPTIEKPPEPVFEEGAVIRLSDVRARSGL